MSQQAEIQGFKVIQLHYTADPDKDEAWAERARRDMPSDDWEREMELKTGGAQDNYPVFVDYKRAYHERTDLIYLPRLKTVYRGWDFGKVHPACEFFQPDGRKINGIGEVWSENELLEVFCQKVLQYSGLNMPGAKFVDWVDATGNKPTERPRIGENDLRTSLQVLRDYGLKPKSRMQDIEPGIDLMKHQMITLVEGRFALQVNPNLQPKLVEALRGGYRRDRRGKIIKDGKHDHYVDAARYALVGMIHFKGGQIGDATEKAKKYHYQPKNQFTGY